MLWAPDSQSTVPPPKLPPARRVLHRQTSAHERDVQLEVGRINAFLPPASLAVDNGRAPHNHRAPRGG